MKHGQNPFHFTPIIDDATLNLAQAVPLLRCWTADLPIIIVENSVAFFTNPWKAAKFLSVLQSSANTLETEIVDISMIQKMISDQGLTSLTIDPCGACGWKNEIEVTGKTREELQKLIVVETQSVKVRIQKVKERCQQLIRQQLYEETFEILRQVTGHLDPGDGECHFLIGLCGIMLNDEQLYLGAEANLKNINSDWLFKLQQLK